MPQLIFVGSVFSGEGKGKKFVALPWFKQQVEQTLGFSPYLGTLNLRLLGEEVAKRRLLETTGSLAVKPQACYYSGLLFKSKLKGEECAVVIPIMPNYPNDVLEVIAPVYLRERLKLVDGCVVSVSVSV